MNLCMAHRGWSGKAPENTLAAIRLALNEPGIQAIELDVQLSKDGVPVVIHDYTLNRTTNGSGAVMDHTFEQLSVLDAGGWFDPAYSGESIPSLEQVLQEVKGKRRLNIELKKGGGMYPGLEQQVLGLVRKYGVENEAVITSFNHEAIRTVSRLAAGEVKTGLIVYGMPALLREQLQHAGASYLSMAYPYLTAQFIEGMIGDGYSLIAWTVDDPQHIEQVMKLHPELQITTNHPDRMISAVKRLAI